MEKKDGKKTYKEGVVKTASSENQNGYYGYAYFWYNTN